jgi:hypothetical protein
MVPIHRGGLADRAHVEHHFHRRPLVQETVQLVWMHHPGRRMLCQVAPLPQAAQRIGDHGFVPAPGQFSMQVGADEAGAASYQDHGRTI